MPAIRLSAQARSVPINAASLAMTVRLTTHQIEQLWRGETVTMSDAPIERLAKALGCEVAALLVSGAATANDSGASPANNNGDDRDPDYDDTPAVMAEQDGSTRGSAQSTREREREPIDMLAMVETSLEGFVLAGLFTDDDAELVANVMSVGDLPSSLVPREVGGFVRAWLDAAAGVRAERNATAEALLDRVIRDAPKGPVKMAQGILAKVNASKAPAKSSGKSGASAVAGAGASKKAAKG